MNEPAASPGVTITTSKGSHEGSLKDCVQWQAKHQGHFATIAVGRFEFDVDEIEFDPEDVGEAFLEVLALIAEEDEDLADRLCSSRFKLARSPVGLVSCPVDYDPATISHKMVKQDGAIRILD